MKTRWPFFILTMFSLAGCMWGVPKKQANKVNTDTLAYTYQTIKQRAGDCGNKPDSGCTVVKINYAFFAGQQALNDSIKHKLLSQFLLRDTTAQTMQQQSASFINAYEKDKKQRQLIDPVYMLNEWATVLRQDSGLVTIEIGGQAYEGGAHGGSSALFFNWNTKTGKKILLSDILIKGYEAPLTKIGESIFRKDEKLSDSATLADDYFFADDNFALNNNFLITPLGIRFLYNEYEIKPYAAGQTDLLIPYTKIKSLLLPHTVVSQYIK